MKNTIKSAALMISIFSISACSFGQKTLTREEAIEKLVAEEEYFDEAAEDILPTKFSYTMSSEGIDEENGHRMKNAGKISISFNGEEPGTFLFIDGNVTDLDTNESERQRKWIIYNDDGTVDNVEEINGVVQRWSTYTKDDEDYAIDIGLTIAFIYIFSFEYAALAGVNETIIELSKTHLEDEGYTEKFTTSGKDGDMFLELSCPSDGFYYKGNFKNHFATKVELSNEGTVQKFEYEWNKASYADLPSVPK